MLDGRVNNDFTRYCSMIHLRKSLLFFLTYVQYKPVCHQRKWQLRAAQGDRTNSRTTMRRSPRTPSAPRRSSRYERAAAAPPPALVFRAVTTDTVADARAVTRVTTRVSGTAKGPKASKRSTPSPNGGKGKAAAPVSAVGASRTAEIAPGGAKLARSATSADIEPHDTRGRKRKAASESAAGTATPPDRKDTGRATKKAKTVAPVGALRSTGPRGDTPGNAAGAGKSAPAEADSREYEVQQGLVLSAEEQSRLLRVAPEGAGFASLIQGRVTADGFESVIDDLFEESEADKRQESLVERFQVYIAGSHEKQRRGDSKAKRGSAAKRDAQYCFGFFEEAGAEKGRRTKNRQCTTRDCTRQECCPREYAASTVEKQGRALANAAGEIGDRAQVFGSPEWAALMRKYRSRQIKNGRSPAKAAPIFQHDLEASMLEADTMVSAATERNNGMVALGGAQASAIISVDTEVGRRTMDISKVTVEAVSFVDRHVRGSAQILFGLIDTKHPIPDDMVLLRCRCPKGSGAEDWDRTCSVCWIERYLALLDAYGIKLGEPETGPFLFPYIFSNAGNGGFPQVGRGRRHGDTAHEKFEHAPTDHGQPMPRGG